VSGPDKNGKPFASWRCAYGADKAAGLRFQDKCNYFARA